MQTDDEHNPRWTPSLQVLASELKGVKERQAEDRDLMQRGFKEDRELAAKTFATKAEIKPVMAVVYGLCGLLLTALVTAIVNIAIHTK